MPNVSRRGMLKSAGALVGATGLAVAPATAARAAAARPAGPATLVLHASALRLLGVKARKPGDAITARGLVSTTEGAEPRGELFITGTRMAAESLLLPSLAAVENHLFVLPEGTLTGTGTVDHDGHGTFTVTGGSGAYAGAHGTYSTRQSADHSGSGTAVVTLVLHSSAR
ncbi:hypothetical protein CLV35_2241 [Motilibacter peucedani]|uniref:Secreted protein n=1 Tax=Motilibacter peucedani TaxID=598650 RepID=A0A420XNH9_9ACTN|nr:hypothetical protein [Motilibacter peucedani]RKS73750.1 hypothetical protein CLV35_2241 [Motilibacter peucedani]